MLPGVILLQDSAPTEDQRAAAALLFAGPRTLITGLEACRRHGLRPSEFPDDNGIHVLVPHEHKLLSSEYVTVERTTRLPTPVVRDEIPLAPVVRAVLDAARRLRSTDPTSKLLIESIQRGGCSTSALLRELNLGNPRGTALPRRLVGEIEGLRSVAELHARRVSEQLQVQPSHWNVSVYNGERKYVGCPDGWWDDVCLAWEIDSLDFHFRSRDYARTLQRNTRYAAAGITVVQTLPSRLLADPAGVIAELEAAHLAASNRPRPQVSLVRSTN